MCESMTLERLYKVVKEDAAIRRVQKLLPAGGPGDKVLPPTYPDPDDKDAKKPKPVHVFEERRIEGERVRCVLLDSVQSQANRLEQALREALHANRLSLPYLYVDFTGQKHRVQTGQNESACEYDLSDIGKITVLDAPHRVFDAIIRDSQLDGCDFFKHDLYRRLSEARPQAATALFEVSPSALLFGAWNSHGEGGGLGSKFARCLVSEIVGVNALEGKRTSSRIDPLGIRKTVKLRGNAFDWRIANGKEDKNGGQGKKGGRLRDPSDLGHSNIRPDVSHLSVTIDYALHIAVISCAGLRRLKFPGEGIKDEHLGRVVLAALGLVALTLQDEMGYDLRSRCTLVCQGRAPFEVVHADGTVDQFTLDAEQALCLFSCAVEKAKEAGLPWKEEPIRLVPQRKLVELVAISRARALEGESEEGSDS